MSHAELCRVPHAVPPKGTSMPHIQQDAGDASCKSRQTGPFENQELLIADVVELRSSLSFALRVRALELPSIAVVTCIICAARRCRPLSASPRRASLR